MEKENLAIRISGVKRKYLHERNDSWNVKSGDQKQNGTDH